MDSKRVLRTVPRTTVAAAVACTVAAGASAAWADAATRTDLHLANLHLGVWRMRVHLASHTTGPPPTRVRSKAYAFRLVTKHSWSGTQFQCLDSLWTRESNWDHRAHNHGSGAYGIPQALPGSKMGYVARDWRYNPHTQIRWGLRYIKGRYGSPCGAWGHFRSHHWY